MGDVGTTQDLNIVWQHDNPLAFEEARVGRVFNRRRPDRRPIAVVKATCEQDIIDAVKLAQKQECRVSVRSGGHSWAAWSVRDNAVLVDLGNYKHLTFNEDERVIVVSPSTTGRILNDFLVPKGYMFPGGHCPDVGLGGFLLQGGMGWNCKNWGWACENVVGIDAVTADGELVHCSAKQNPDLFWMARGGGPGFPAIVTKFHLKVRPASKAMSCSFFAWPMSEYRAVLNWVKDTSSGYDESTEIVALSQSMPGQSSHCVCALFVSFKDTEQEARAVLEPANSSRPEGCIVEEINQPTSLADQYVNQAAANPEGHRYCTDNAYISNDEDVAAVLETAFTTLPSEKSFALYYAMNPCSRRTLPDMALSMQSDHYFAIYSVWETPEQDAKCQSWVRETLESVEKFSEGAYLGDSDFQVRRPKFWTDENARKLMVLRRQRDPHGRICGYLDLGDASGVNGLPVEGQTNGAVNQCEAAAK